MVKTNEFFERLTKSLGDAFNGEEDDEETKKAKVAKEAADKEVADKAAAEAKTKADAEAEVARKAKEQSDAQVPEAVQKTLDTFSERIAVLEKTLTSDEDGSLRQVITSLAVEVENTREALGKGLDTLKAVVDRTVVKKSLAGDDAGSDGKGEQDEKMMEKRADDEFEQGILTMLKTGQPLILK